MTKASFIQAVQNSRWYKILSQLSLIYIKSTLREKLNLLQLLTLAPCIKPSYP